MGAKISESRFMLKKRINGRVFRIFKSFAKIAELLLIKSQSYELLLHIAATCPFYHLSFQARSQGKAVRMAYAGTQNKNSRPRE